MHPYFLFQVLHYPAAYLQEGDFADFGVVLDLEEALLSVQEGFLGLTHLDSGQVTKQVTLLCYIHCLLCGLKVLLLQFQQHQVVLVSLPEIVQVGTELQFQLVNGDIGRQFIQTGVALLYTLLSANQVYADGGAE